MAPMPVTTAPPPRPPRAPSRAGATKVDATPTPSKPTPMRPAQPQKSAKLKSDVVHLSATSDKAAPIADRPTRTSSATATTIPIKMPKGPSTTSNVPSARPETLTSSKSTLAANPSAPKSTQATPKTPAALSAPSKTKTAASAPMPLPPATPTTPSSTTRSKTPTRAVAAARPSPTPPKKGKENLGKAQPDAPRKLSIPDLPPPTPSSGAGNLAATDSDRVSGATVTSAAPALVRSPTKPLNIRKPATMPSTLTPAAREAEKAHKEAPKLSKPVTTPLSAPALLKAKGDPKLNPAPPAVKEKETGHKEKPAASMKAKLPDSGIEKQSRAERAITTPSCPGSPQLSISSTLSLTPVARASAKLPHAATSKAHVEKEKAIEERKPTVSTKPTATVAAEDKQKRSTVTSVVERTATVPPSATRSSANSSQAKSVAAKKAKVIDQMNPTVTTKPAPAVATADKQNHSISTLVKPTTSASRAPSPTSRPPIATASTRSAGEPPVTAKQNEQDEVPVAAKAESERTPSKLSTALPLASGSPTSASPSTVSGQSSIEARAPEVAASQVRRRPKAIALDRSESWENSDIVKASWTPRDKRVLVSVAADESSPSGAEVGPWTKTSLTTTESAQDGGAPSVDGKGNTKFTTAKTAIESVRPAASNSEAAGSRQSVQQTEGLRPQATLGNQKVPNAGLDVPLSNAARPLIHMHRSESSDQVASRKRARPLTHSRSLDLRKLELTKEQQELSEALRKFLHLSFPIKGYPDGRLSEARHLLRGAALFNSLEDVFIGLQACFELQGELTAEAWTDVQLAVAMICKVIAILPRDPTEEGDASHKLKYWLEHAHRAARSGDITIALESVRRRLRSGAAAATTLSDETIENVYPPTREWTPPTRIADVFVFDCGEARDVLAQQMALGAAQLWMELDPETLVRYKSMGDQFDEVMKTMNAERRDQILKTQAAYQVLVGHVNITLELVLHSLLSAAFDDTLVPAFNIWVDIAMKCYAINDFLTTSAIHQGLAHSTVSDVLDHIYGSAAPPSCPDPRTSEVWQSLDATILPFRKSLESHTLTLMGNEGPQVPDMASVTMHVYNYGTMCRAEVSDSASREAASARVAANIGRYIPLGAAIEALEKSQLSYGYRDVQVVQRWLADSYAALGPGFSNNRAYDLRDMIIDPECAKKRGGEQKTKKPKMHGRSTSGDGLGRQFGETIQKFRTARPSTHLAGSK